MPAAAWGVLVAAADVELADGLLQTWWHQQRI
jgi:hypothetical protein